MNSVVYFFVTGDDASWVMFGTIVIGAFSLALAAVAVEWLLTKIKNRRGKR